MLKWLLVIAVGVVIISLATPWLARRGLGRLPGDITLLTMIANGIDPAR